MWIKNSNWGFFWQALPSWQWLTADNRHPALRTSKTGSNTSERWSKSAPFTWEEHLKNPFIFPKQPPPSTTRDEGKHSSEWGFIYEQEVYLTVYCTIYTRREEKLHLLLIVCAPIRDGEDLDSQGEGSSQPDTISLASRTSQNTLDSDKVRTHTQSSEMMPSLQIFWIHQL